MGLTDKNTEENLQTQSLNCCKGRIQNQQASLELLKTQTDHK